MWFFILYSFVSVGSFFFCLAESTNFLCFWVLLELLSLSVTPYFFFEVFPRSFRALMQYLVISGIASILMFGGVFASGYEVILVGTGVLLKLGVFPFMSWVYEIVIHTNGVVIWFFSGLLKIPFVLILYMLGPGSFSFVFLCVLCFVVLGLNIWKSMGGWRRLWGHMLVSGSASLVIIGMLCPTEISVCVYWVYFIWSSLGLAFFTLLPKLRSFSESLYFFCFIILFISFPFSLAIFYKYALGVSMLMANSYIFTSWCFYSVSEQLYLIYYLIGRGKHRRRVSLFSSV